MMVQAEVYPGVVYPPPNQGHLGGYQQRQRPPPPPQKQGPQYPSNGYYDNAFAAKVVQKPFPASPYHNENYQHMTEEEDQEEDDEEAWDAIDNHPTGWKNEYHEPGYGGNNGFQASPGRNFNNSHGGNSGFQSSTGGNFNNSYGNDSYYEEAIPVAVAIRPPPRRVLPPVGRGGFGSSRQYQDFEHNASPVYQKPPPSEYWRAQEARPVYQKPPEYYWATKDVKPSYPKDVGPGFQKPEYWATKDVKPGFQKPEYWATKDVKPGFQRPEYRATANMKPAGYPKQEYWAVKGV